MAGPLSGRVALVTGSDVGLGLDIAQDLATAGARVVLTGIAADQAGRGIAADLARKAGVQTLFHPADLRDLAAIERLAAAAEGRFGGIDILINNAVVRHFHPVEEYSPAEWDLALAVNLSAPFHLARLLVPGMKRRGWGRIVNLSSIYGQRGAADRVDYVTTKTGLLGMTRALAVELARTGITCNAVSPGTLPTGAILDRIAAQARAEGIGMEEAQAAYLTGRNPTGRFVGTAAVSAMIRLLCSPAGDDITGATLPVDGGWSAA